MELSVPESRVETRDRLLMEVGIVLDVPRRTLYDTNNPNPSPTTMALTQCQYHQELNEWVNQFREFITIHGSEVPHFWNIVMGPCYEVGNLLLNSESIAQKRDHFETTVAQIRAAFRSIPVDEPAA